MRTRLTGFLLAILLAVTLATVLAVLPGGTAFAQIGVAAKISDVRGTKHNFSAIPDNSVTPSGGTVPVRTVKAASETQVCVFCHTPHNAEQIVFGTGPNASIAPLWNRKLSGQTYTPYSSSSLEASATELAIGPGGSSKLCLSCHDGTMAVNKVSALNGARDVVVQIAGQAAGTEVTMPGGSGAATGFTRNIGTDLTSDHPISFTYDAAVATADGELRTPDGTIVGTRSAGSTPPRLPLEKGQMQCATCHDPHLRDNNPNNGNAKFLRLNRFQVTQPTGGAFNATQDIICLACHDKAGVSWAFSAHASSSVATQLYKSGSATLREFPGTPPVWQVSCLNCHDTHSAQGSRRLLREGTDSTSSPKSGGNSAIEETCYQCHTTSAESAVTYAAGTANAIPDIKTDFTLLNGIRMPIRSADQLAGSEVHDIGGTFNDSIDANCGTATGKCGKDFLESRAKLGLDNPNNRHAECSDCHNPHRVIKGQNGLPGILNATNTSEKAGTHRHENATGFIHSNVISGVLRGTWGVEPVYPDRSFHSMPSGFDVKRGDPGTSTDTQTSAKHVTREYQICLKCHSNYGYSDDNVYPSGSSRPSLGGSGATAVNANNHTNFSRYTNQAKEFQAPSTHAVSPGSVSLGFEAGAGALATNTATNNNNHRSWHPVMAPTGRTGRSGSWLAPWNNSGTGGQAGRLGVQTMFCSDCHGSATGTGTVMPNGNTATNENGSAWGPHGSTNNFLLKGTWSSASGEGDANTLCFKCHASANYGGTSGGTGFNTGKGDGHSVHSDRIDTNMKCNFCHVAVPHGWKNRGLLVNLRDVGPEAGLARGTDVGNGPYTNGPYYRRAYLRITSFPSGSSWSESNCNGGRDAMKNQCENAT